MNQVREMYEVTCLLTVIAARVIIERGRNTSGEIEIKEEKKEIHTKETERSNMEETKKTNMKDRKYNIKENTQETMFYKRILVETASLCKLNMYIYYRTWSMTT
jgi:hypothetical protein